MNARIDFTAQSALRQYLADAAIMALIVVLAALTILTLATARTATTSPGECAGLTEDQCVITRTDAGSQP